MLTHHNAVKAAVPHPRGAVPAAFQFQIDLLPLVTSFRRRSCIVYYPKYSEDLVHCEVLLPENAPEEYKEPYVLWNSVELVEKAKDAKSGTTNP